MRVLFIFLFFFNYYYLNAQDKPPLSDSIKLFTGLENNVSKKEIKNPKVAAIHSAILPGWGQIYNHKYWKLPIVYGALGTTAYIFYDNLKYYKEVKFAYLARYKAALPIPYNDSSDYFKIKNIYKIISPNSILQERNTFRKYIDYSVLLFVVFWGLNVVDATVDAQLSSFDVGPNLSLQIKPGYSCIAQTNGISFSLHFMK